MTFAGIYVANTIRFADDDIANNMLQATATSAAVLLGLGHAGVGDLTTATIAGLAGVAAAIEGIAAPVEDATGGFSLNPLNWKWPLGPIWNQ